MHRDAYQVGRLLSRQARCSRFLVILTNSYTIPSETYQNRTICTPSLKAEANTLQKEKTDSAKLPV